MIKLVPRSLTVLAALFLTNLNARAQPSQMEFRVFSDTASGALFYIAPASISKTGNVVSAWWLQNFPGPMGNAKAKSKLGSVVVDCEAKEMQEGVATFWSEHSASGTRLGSMQKQPVTPLAEGTPAASFYWVLCRPYAEAANSLNTIEHAAKKKGVATRIDVNRALLQ